MPRACELSGSQRTVVRMSAEARSRCAYACGEILDIDPTIGLVGGNALDDAGTPNLDVGAILRRIVDAPADLELRADKRFIERRRLVRHHPLDALDEARNLAPLALAL